MSKKSILSIGNRLLAVLAACAVVSSYAFSPVQKPSDGSGPPANVLLALSVEFPTGLQVSYSTTSYRFSNGPHDGYFDNRKCYRYDGPNEVFRPVSAMNATTGGCPGSDQWSGDLLNWLTMTNLDQFRSVLTGGTRDNFSTMNATAPGDTTASTILIRSFSDRNSYNPVKTLSGGTPGMPLAGNWSARSGGYGSKFFVSSSDFTDLNATQQRENCASTVARGLSGMNQCYNIRVEACKIIPASGTTPAVGMEANCQPVYSGVPKPEGLIQGYSSTLRFGAFGYANDTGNGRNGGVLRAAMKSVGPLAATATVPVANSAKEWDPATGVMIDNPNPADALATGVSSSGLMNYLNQFGYAAGYKGNDPVSELYYAALLYLRNKALPPSYSAGLTAAMKDGFPVITSPPDPAINSCQKNFIIGIGDIYTHCDGNLPGGNDGGCPGPTPADPDGLNVESLWSTVASLEGSSSWVGGSNQGRPYIAGLAHWAHTNDIRADLTGKQTIDTYFVDVLENTNGQGSVLAASRLKTQYWFATKYGGFRSDLVPGNDPNANPLSWQTGGDTIPNTWFAGSTPGSLKAGLTRAFADIQQRTGSGSASGAAVSSTRQTSGSQVLYAGYEAKTWSGTLRSCAPGASVLSCTTSPVWEASRWLDSSYTLGALPKLTAATRKIITSDPTAVPTKMPFVWTSLSANQKALLNAGDGLGQNRVAFLRGDRTDEGTLFRTRGTSLLGDIVNSGVTYVGTTTTPRSGPNFPGYSSYRASVRARPPVVYVGANDGMLHAFDNTNGRELFAYVPSSVFSNLPALSAPGFEHRYFVDSTPMVGDIETAPSTWGTLLVGGLGGGGKGYYALDITQQASFSAASETWLASLPRWEFTSNNDADLGYTFNEPSTDPISGAHRQITKVADNATATGVWRAIVGNGYGATAGNAVLFMLDANTGAAATKLQAAGGPSNGLSTPTPVDTDRDGLIDTIYAGDLAGALHKFQFSKASGGSFVVAKSGDAAGQWRYLGKLYDTGEPITTAPSVAPSCDLTGWNVMVGTGKLNEEADYIDTSTRRFISVIDNAPSTSLLVNAAQLATLSPVVSTTGSGAVVRNWTAPNMSGRKGWQIVFSGGERVLSNSTLPPDTGTVLFATSKPSGNVCTPGNSGFLMSVNMCSGAIGNLVFGTETAGGLSMGSSGVLKVSDTITRSDNNQGVICNQDDCKNKNPAVVMSITGRGRYSWREVLTK